MKNLLFILGFVFSVSAFATTPDAIKACKNVDFILADDLNECLTSNARAETIQACTHTGLIEATHLNKCIRSGASASTIDACSAADLEASDLIKCVRSKKSAKVIDACSGLDGADFITCIRS